MRVVLAPDSFKGSLPAGAVASALADGWLSVRRGDEVVLRPMADGGEGTLAVIAAAVSSAETRSLEVLGANHEPRSGRWLMLPQVAHEPKTAVVELASACGIEGLADLVPMTSSTFGLGQVISAAVASGAKRILIGLGSSASTDGGSGMLSALGASLLDADGKALPLGGAALSRLARIDMAGLIDLRGVELIGLTDVNSPLLGQRGAARVFGPQKGASPQQVETLEAALTRLSEVAGAALAELPGAGAAGGTGFGLLLLGAQLQAGADSIAELIGLAPACVAADLVITGEGRFDSQSAAGKVPAKVVAVAAGKTALVAGQISPDADLSGFVSAVSLAELAGSAERAMQEAQAWLREAGATLASGYETAR